MKVSPLAGKLADPASLLNVPQLVTAYYTQIPDTSIPIILPLRGSAPYIPTHKCEGFRVRFGKPEQ
jgi:hypothetical protein